MVPLVLVLMVIVAAVLLMLLEVIWMISGLTSAALESLVSLLTNMLVTFFPTSLPLHDDANSVNETLRGGYKTSYVGSCSKHRIISGVVRLWMMVYTLLRVNLSLREGGTTCL